MHCMFCDLWFVHTQIIYDFHEKSQDLLGEKIQKKLHENVLFQIFRTLYPGWLCGGEGNLEPFEDRCASNTVTSFGQIDLAVFFTL